MIKYDSIHKLIKEAEKKNKKISEVVLEDQVKAMEKAEAELYKKMEESFEAGDLDNFIINSSKFFKIEFSFFI